MDNRYKIHDTETKELYVGVTSHYFKLSDAKDAYRNSLIGEGSDDSILIEIAKIGASKVDGSVAFGVEEGEQFALALLNLCHSIRR
ncbi:hypothetical protein D1864_07540 [Oceanobacillus picturae]|nr:hypothetical protein D1864_07540 [Oceanobacillus picturae]